MAEKAFITPMILKWARESARISLEDSAKKVNVSIEKFTTWENGTEYPTIRQAQILAKTYRRPFSLFFLPEIPRDFHPLQDFRKSDSLKLDTASLFIIREIQQKQTWISELFEDSREEPLNFVGKFSINSNAKDVANDILTTLNITPGNYQKEPIKEWVEKTELAGIFISRTSFIHSKLVLNKDIIQGFAIADKFAPFIFINSKNWKAPQLFTLVHELAHIWISESGISNEIDIDFSEKNISKYNPVELFCNQVAANVLMPEEKIRELSNYDFSSNKEIFQNAKIFGISSFALLVRALKLNIITQAEYKSLKLEAENEFANFLEREELKKEKQKKNAGGPDPYLLKLNKNSRLFTRVVMDSFKTGMISPSIASNLLNTQINKFQKFEKLLV